MLLALLTKEDAMRQRRGGIQARRLSQWVVRATLLLAIAAGMAAALRADESSTIYPSIREQQPLRQYRAYRRMHARSEHFGQEAWVEAWTELNGQSFTYTIVSEKGPQGGPETRAGARGRRRVQPIRTHARELHVRGNHRRRQRAVRDIEAEAERPAAGGWAHGAQPGWLGAAPRRGPACKEPLVLDQPRQRHSPLHPDRRRARADRD